MKKIFFITTLGLMISVTNAHATTVYCSTVTCGDWDDAGHTSFCDTSAKWCTTSFASAFGSGIYKYCMPYGGYYLYSGENYKATHNIVCYSDQTICNKVATMQVPWTTSSGYTHPAKGYFIGGLGCDDGSITSTDYYGDVYACPAGKYNRYGVRAIESDGASGLGCTNCSAGYYSQPASISSDCTQCPLASNIYTNSSRTTLARGTVTAGNGTSAEACYLPVGTYYDEKGTFSISTTGCTY